MTARQLVRRRRSAVDMDRHTTIDAGAFYALLARTLPSLSATPWETVHWPVAIHLAIFVHRVVGIPAVRSALWSCWTSRTGDEHAVVTAWACRAYTPWCAMKPSSATCAQR